MHFASTTWKQVLSLVTLLLHYGKQNIIIQILVSIVELKEFDYRPKMICEPNITIVFMFNSDNAKTISGLCMWYIIDFNWKLYFTADPSKVYVA